MGALPDELDNYGGSLPKIMVAPMDIKHLDPTENTNSAELYLENHLHITCAYLRPSGGDIPVPVRSPKSSTVERG